jgi:uncharacterized membrane protein
MAVPATTLGIAAGTFLAAAVEFVEAFTIILAMGVTRSWRAAILGAMTALLWAILGLLAAWLMLSRIAVAAILRRHTLPEVAGHARPGSSGCGP